MRLYLNLSFTKVSKGNKGLFFVVCVPQEGDSEIAAKMQDLALAEGALPRHLHTAMFTQSTDNRLLTNRYVSLLTL